jgi:hypothetical protein
MAEVKQSDLMYLITNTTEHNYDNYELIVDILDICCKIGGDYENHKEKNENLSCKSDENTSSQQFIDWSI